MNQLLTSSYDKIAGVLEKNLTCVIASAGDFHFGRAAVQRDYAAKLVRPPGGKRADRVNRRISKPDKGTQPPVAGFDGYVSAAARDHDLDARRDEGNIRANFAAFGK